MVRRSFCHRQVDVTRDDAERFNHAGLQCVHQPPVLMRLHLLHCRGGIVGIGVRSPLMGLLKSADEKQQRADAKAEAEFWSSPVGRARTAHNDGDLFFQVEIPHSKVKADVPMTAGRNAKVAYASGGTDTLSGIVAEGWRLVNSGWVYVQTGQESRDKFLASGQQTVTRGEVVGIYLFERSGR